MMKDMKMSQTEKKDSIAMSEAPKGDEYPWGLRLRLGEAELKRLGIDKLPKAGTSFPFSAEAKIISTHEDASENNKNRSVEVQVTAIDLDSEDESSESDKGSKVYPDQGK